MLRTVLDTMPAVVMRVSLDGTITFINRVLPEYAGTPPVGRSIYDFAPADQHEVMRQSLARAIETRGPVSFESIAEAPDGTRDWYSTTLGPVLDGEALVALTMVSTNVSHVKRIEQALRDARTHTALALDAGNVGTWRWDQREDVVVWDDKLCALFGLTQAEAPKTYPAFLALASDDQREALRRHIDTAVATGAYPDFELRADLPSGTRWFIIKGGTLRDAEGRVTGLLGGVIDDTDRRKLAEHLRQSQKLEAVGQLSAGVAHNFNNMLAIIVPVLEMLERRANGQDAALVADALASALNAADLVRQLMLFARTRPHAAARQEPLAVALERAVALCRRTFDRRITLTMDGVEAARDVSVDAAEMEQAVLNLLLNARDALEGVDAPRIDVTVRRVARASARWPEGASPDSAIEVRVRDNGRGMDEPTRQRIFEPFFTTKPVGQGTGLGLSTAWAMAQRHGGFIECESALDAGTTFSLVLPIAQVDAHPGAPPPPQAAARGDGQKVLIIDDEPAVRRASAATLAAWGYTPLTAASGDEGVALSKQTTVDVVLLDYSMPGLSAESTIEQLRALRPGLPIVCFSGLGVTLEGATAHLAKPATFEALVAAVGGALARRP